MDAYVADANALIDHLGRDGRALSRKARRAFEQALAGTALIYVPVTALAELSHANMRRHWGLDMTRLMRDLERSAQFVILGIELEDIVQMQHILGARGIDDIFDALAICLARKMDATLITTDAAIAASDFVRTI